VQTILLCLVNVLVLKGRGGGERLCLGSCQVSGSGRGGATVVERREGGEAVKLGATGCNGALKPVVGGGVPVVG